MFNLDVKILNKVRLFNRALQIKKGGILMSKLNVSQKDIVEENKKQKQSVIDKIKGFDSFLSYESMPEKQEYSSNVEYKQKRDLSNDEISSQAKELLSNYEKLNKNKINENYDSKITSNSNEMKSLEQNLENEEQSVREKFNDAKNSATEKIISNGLGRGSIVKSKLSSLSDEEKNEIENLRTVANSELEKLKEKELSLENERDNALSNFSIDYAVKVQDKIDELAKEITDYNNKVIEYNNKLNQEEKDNQLAYEKYYNSLVEDYKKQNQELTKFLKKYGYSTYNSYVLNQKVGVIEDYLNTLDKDSALQVLTEDDSFKNLIGDDSFNSLIQKVKDRKN
jgi:hypothetical protein